MVFPLVHVPPPFSVYYKVVERLVSRCDEVVVVAVPLDAQAASWASCGGLRRGDAKALGGAL